MTKYWINWERNATATAPKPLDNNVVNQLVVVGKQLVNRVW